MKISSHRMLIQAITESVFAICAKTPNAFSMGVCFGYAATVVEAIHADALGPFYARLNGEFNETLEARHRFFFGMALHQNPELFPEQFLPKTNLVMQNIPLTSSVTSPEKIRARGGLAYLMKHAGCYDMAGLNKALCVVHQALTQYQQEGTFVLVGGEHAIALYLQPTRAYIASTMWPAKPETYPIEQPDDLQNITKRILTLLNSVRGKPVSQKLENHLVITWNWLCCQHDVAAKTPLKNAIINHSLFQQTDSLPLASLPDKKGMSWSIATLQAQETAQLKAMLTLHPSLKLAKEQGMGLVTMAAYYHLPEALYCLLQEGEDPNVMDDTGFRPLHYALLNCDLQILKILLEFKADQELTSSNGLKPLTYAKSQYRKATDYSVKEKYQEMIQIMAPARLQIS